VPPVAQSATQRKAPGRSLRALVVALALFACAGATAAESDAFPTRPIRIVMGAPAGSGIDFVMRLLTEPMQAELGVPIVIDPRPGADGIIAAELVAKSPADGYVVMAATHTQLVANPVTRANLPYDVERDFLLLTLVTDHHFVLAVHPSLPAHTLRELRDVARSRPGGVDTASPAITFRLMAAALADAMGVELRAIPYNGMSAALNAVLAGHVPAAVLDASVALEAVRGGRLRALAVGARQRLDVLPDVPTFAEAGYPVLDAPLWVALVAPAGVPAPVAERLRGAVHRALASQDVRAQLGAAAILPRPSSPGELVDSIRTERAAFSRDATRLGVGPD